MCPPYIDKIILNLLSLLIAGAGIFSILIKFSVPQLNMSFYGENPFAVKRDIIEKVMTWIFMILACIGFFIQAYVIIFDTDLVTNIYSTNTYIKFFLIGLLAIITIIIALGAIGRFISKKIWLPEIIERFSKSYKEVGEMLSKDDMEDICQKRLSTIEELLEIDKKSLNTKERFYQLSKFFKNNS